MKTLDEVISTIESGMLISEKPFSEAYRELLNDALVYLKIYQSDALLYEFDRKRWKEDMIKSLEAFEKAKQKFISTMKARNNGQECSKDARWIPVDDRMPTKRGTYLTFCRFRDGQTEIKVKLWTPTIGFTSQPKAVTHWMPLPDAPEEERNGK